MKVKRLRRVRKTLSFFKNNYNFRTPYQVLIDGTFCSSALQFKINLKEQIPKYLEAEIKFLTTACVISEVEALGPSTYGAMLVVKQFAVRKCGHEKSPIPASECLHSMLSADNSDHYFVATQDPELIEKIRNMPGVPLLYIRYNTIILGKPSGVNTEVAEKKSNEQLNSSDYHMTVLKQLKKAVFGEPEKKVKKRKFKGGPNPLSCKKKTPKSEQQITEVVQEKKKRPRQRVKFAKHVKAMLLANEAESLKQIAQEIREKEKRQRQRDKLARHVKAMVLFNKIEPWKQSTEELQEKKRDDDVRESN